MPEDLDRSQGAHRCWTGAMQTSENRIQAKFAEFFFQALR
jgi:hypothetical protein